MSSALTETATNADFGTGLIAPDVGADFTTECNTTRSAFQEIVDRSQALRLLSGVVMASGLATKKVMVPIGYALRNAGEFTYVSSSGAHYYQQTSVAGVGNLQFEVPQLPIGSKITGAYAWWANPNNVALAVGTMPALALTKNVYSVGAGASPGTYDAAVASASDATAVVGTYQLMHKVAITGLSEVVAEDVVYRVGFTGETGANATTGGNLAAIFVTLSV